jgi:hypothetical protein
MSKQTRSDKLPSDAPPKPVACPVCGSGVYWAPLRWEFVGRFWACNRFPKCDTRLNRNETITRVNSGQEIYVVRSTRSGDALAYELVPARQQVLTPLLSVQVGPTTRKLWAFSAGEASDLPALIEKVRNRLLLIA